jgi:hypothetical protein
MADGLRVLPLAGGSLKTGAESEESGELHEENKIGAGFGRIGEIEPGRISDDRQGPATRFRGRGSGNFLRG